MATLVVIWMAYGRHDHHVIVDTYRLHNSGAGIRSEDDEDERERVESPRHGQDHGRIAFLGTLRVDGRCAGRRRHCGG